MHGIRSLFRASPPKGSNDDDDDDYVDDGIEQLSVLLTSMPAPGFHLLLE